MLPEPPGWPASTLISLPALTVSRLPVASILTPPVLSVPARMSIRSSAVTAAAMSILSVDAICTVVGSISALIVTVPVALITTAPLDVTLSAPIPSPMLIIPPFNPRPPLAVILAFKSMPPMPVSIAKILESLSVTLSLKVSDPLLIDVSETLSSRETVPLKVKAAAGSSAIKSPARPVFVRTLELILYIIAISPASTRSRTSLSTITSSSKNPVSI